MTKIIHICFGDSGRGSLKVALKGKLIEGDKVIGFSDDMCHGLIDCSVDERLKWCKTLIEEDKIEHNHVEYLRENYRNFLKKVSKIKDSNTVCLWYGNSSREICGMMYTLQLLKNKLINIYAINVSDLIFEISNGIFIPRTVGELSPEKLSQCVKIKRNLLSEEINNLLEQWNTLIKENSILRAFKEGKVQSVNENYFDEDILKYTEKEFRKSARIVGSVLGYSETFIDDGYIFWRVKELCKAGKLEYKGTFGIMREMEIKISEAGLKYLSNNSEAMELWKNREEEIDTERRFINETKEEGRKEERIDIARRLLDVLDADVIAEKTGLTVGQVKNLKI